MKQQIYKIKEFFKSINPYYTAKKQEDARAHRFSVLERLTQKYGSISLVPFEELEREAAITETRNDLGNYISCT